MTEKIAVVVKYCLLPVGTFNLCGCADVNLLCFDMPMEKFHSILAIHSPYNWGGGEGIMSVCSLPADFFSFINYWIQKIVDIGIANGPVCNVT